MKKKCATRWCYVSRRLIETEMDHCLICGRPLIPDVNTVEELIEFLIDKENK